MTHLPRGGSAVLTVLLTACAGAGQAPPPSMTPLPASERATQPDSSVAPSPLTTTLRPESAVPVGDGGHIIRVAAVGDEVWATADRSIVRIDTQTEEVTTVETPVAADGADSFGATTEAVWLGDFGSGSMYRLDPETGVVLAELSVTRPVGFAEADGMIWVGDGSASMMVTIDPSGSKATSTDIPMGHVAGDSVWSISTLGRVDRIAIDTGEVTPIDVPEPQGPGNCAVKGSYPDSLWVLCHENDYAARIDPETNSVIATPEVGSPVFGGVHTIEHWAFFLEGRDEAGAHDGRIVRVDLNTNEIDRVFELGPEFDPNTAVIAGEAMWVPVEPAGEVWRLPLAELLVP